MLKYLQIFFQYSSRMQFPWVRVTILLALATVGLCVADSELNGSFKDSSVGVFLADTGVEDKVNEIRDAVNRKVNDVIGERSVTDRLKESGVYVVEMLRDAMVGVHIHFHMFDSCAEGLNNGLAWTRDSLLATLANIRSVLHLTYE